MDVRKEMLEVRERFYERGDKAQTIEEYRRILKRAEVEGAPDADKIICGASIGMVLHEQNLLAEAVEAYDAVLQYPLDHVVRARVLQNKAAALAASKQYRDAVRTGELAFEYAQRAGAGTLAQKLLENLGTFRELAARSPERIIIVGVGKRGESIDEKVENN